MLFITGPLYSGKRTFAKPFGGRQIYEVQTLAANAESLPALADELAALPACWLSGPTVWCRCSAACPPC